MRTPDRSAQELRRSEQRFRLLVDSVVDYAIFLLDTDGVVRSWNPGAERLKGYSEQEIVGRHYSVFYPPELREEGVPARLLKAAARDGSARHAGWRVRKDGSRFWAEVVITALREDDGSLTGFAKVTRDMTEAHEVAEARREALATQARSLEDLRRLDEWRRDFIRAIAHDLQAPVVSIAGFATILEADDPSPDERDQYVERIAANARTLQQLIDHLRTYTQLEAGEVALELAPTDLSTFVGTLVDNLGPVLEGRELTVDVPAVVVPVDRRGLERILTNLLSNAARHTPVGGAIRVSARRNAEGVEIAVADEGAGIDPELLPHVFDRFERGEAGSTGLGLAIVKQFTEMHGGTVRAESEPGRGSTFRVTLPGD